MTEGAPLRCSGFSDSLLVKIKEKIRLDSRMCNKFDSMIILYFR